MEPWGICDRVARYFSAYYAETRTQLLSYASIQEAIPNFLKDYTRRIVVDVCQDGVLVIHYAVEGISSDKRELFQFYGGNYHQGVSVKDAVKSAALPLDWDYNPEDPWRVTMADFRLHKGADTTGPVAWEAPWQRIDAVGSTAVSAWSEALGRAEARADVLGFVNSHLMGLQERGPGQALDQVISELEFAISEFRELLNNDRKRKGFNSS